MRSAHRPSPNKLRCLQEVRERTNPDSGASGVQIISKLLEWSSGYQQTVSGELRLSANYSSGVQVTSKLFQGSSGYQQTVSGEFRLSANCFRRVQVISKLFQESSGYQQTVSGEFRLSANCFRRVQVISKLFQESSGYQQTVSGEFRLPANCFRRVQVTSKLFQGSSGYQQTVSGEFRIPANCAMGAHTSRLCYFESSLDLLMQASTAFTMISSSPHSSNTFTASMVVPPGEQTLIFSCSGESSLSMASLAEPKTV